MTEIEFKNWIIEHRIQPHIGYLYWPLRSKCVTFLQEENSLEHEAWSAYSCYQITTKYSGASSMSDGLNVLLELNGYTYRMDKGYWVKFEAYLVNATDQVPHGISYSVTLHDRHNRRVIGFDNAHGYAPSSRRKKFGCRRVTWDHKHNCEKVSNYDFESAAQLIEDFWEEVSKII